MRSAEEGSTILYTVRYNLIVRIFLFAKACFSVLHASTAGALTTNMKSRMFVNESRLDCRIYIMKNRVAAYYTYTPTVQNIATTPNPPRALAINATPVSRTGSVSLDRLYGACQRTKHMPGVYAYVVK